MIVTRVTINQLRVKQYSVINPVIITLETRKDTQSISGEHYSQYLGIFKAPGSKSIPLYKSNEKDTITETTRQVLDENEIPIDTVDRIDQEYFSFIE